MSNQQAQIHNTPITKSDAIKIMSVMDNVITSLIDAIQEETKLVRMGAYDSAAIVAQSKTEISTDYMSETKRINELLPLLEQVHPQGVYDMRKNHEGLKAELQINMAVLATARESAEDLIRTVATEVQKESQPAVYTPYGALYDSGKANTGIAYNVKL